MEDHKMFTINKFVDQNRTLDSMYEVDDFMNSTCPPDIIGGFDSKFIQSISMRDASFRKEFDQTVTSALVSQDPCSLADDERDLLLRRKRKEDAYKTALCESFRRNNICAYGDECRFAHGVEELRLPSQPRGRTHPKYKTVLCDKFSTTGYCKYGSRCQFIHKITNPVILQKREMLTRLSDNDKENRNFSFRSRDFGSTNLNQSLPMDSIDRKDINRAFTRAAESGFGGLDDQFSALRRLRISK